LKNIQRCAIITVAHLLFWGDIMKIFSSKKHLFSFTFIAFYFIFSFLGAVRTFSTFTGLLYDVMGLISSALILCYLLFEQKIFKFKSLIFPLAFGIIAFRSLYGVITYFDGLSRFTILEIELEVEITFAIIIVAALFNILCFCGTLFKFKSSLLLKIGCIGYILTTVASQIYEFYLVGGMEYIKASPINVFAFIQIFSIILFYIGIFILPTNKRNKDLV